MGLERRHHLPRRAIASHSSRVSASGGEPAPLTKLNDALGENSHRGPTFLPDGRRFLFTSRCADSANNALYLGSLDSPKRSACDERSIEGSLSARREVAERAALLYYRDGGLEARTFDPDRNALGDPRPVIANVDYNSAGIGAFFQASANGRVMIIRPAGASRGTADLVRAKRGADRHIGCSREGM